MKKYLIAILILLAASPVGATNYYACNSSTDITSNNWCTAAASGLGSCAGTADTTWATANNAANTLYANGCTLAIPNGTTVSAGKLSTKDGDAGGNAVAGGGFTATANGITVTIDSSIEGGTTDCLTIGSTNNTVTANILTTNGGGTITTDATANADGTYISGSAATVTIGKSGSPVTVTGGSAANYAINDAHTSTTTTMYATINGGTGSTSAAYFLGTSAIAVITGDVTGGSASNAFGLSAGAGGTLTLTGAVNGGSAAGAHGIHSSSTGTITVNGKATGGSAGTASSPAYGINSAGSATITLNGDAEGGSSQNADGLRCNTTANAATITGSIISTDKSSGASGRIIWSPSASTKYIKIIGDGSPAAYYLTSNVAGGAHPAVADVKSGTEYGWDGSAVYTGELSTSGGGGAWGF